VIVDASEEKSVDEMIHPFSAELIGPWKKGEREELRLRWKLGSSIKTSTGPIQTMLKTFSPLLFLPRKRLSPSSISWLHRKKECRFIASEANEEEEGVLGREGGLHSAHLSVLGHLSFPYRLLTLAHFRKTHLRRRKEKQVKMKLETK